MGLSGSKQEKYTKDQRPTRKQVPDVDDNDRAILDIKVQRDQLLMHQRKVQQRLASDEEALRCLVRSKRKPQAMLALRRKKQHEQLAADCEGHLLRLEELIDQIEAARVQQGVVEALATGVATLKRVQQETGGVDYVQKLLDERDDLLDQQQELADVIGSGAAAEDPEVLAEFARLEAAVAAEPAQNKLQPQVEDASPQSCTAQEPLANPKGDSSTHIAAAARQ